ELTFTITTAPTHGTLGALSPAACSAGSPNTDTATVLYTPTAGYSGTDSFTFTVTDGGSLSSAPATISLTVTNTPPPNTAPSAVASSATTAQDTPVMLTLSGHDAESCELTFAIATAPADGSLGSLGGQPCSAGSPNTDAATVLYTPNAGYSGTDSFTFTVTDGGSLTSPAATISLTVTASGGGGGSGTISFVAASSAANPTATTLVLPAPEGLAAGDVLLASLSVRGKPSIDAPSGWTLVRLDDATTTMEQGIWVHVVGATEPTSYTFTFDKAQAAAGGIVAYRGVDPTAPIDTSAGLVNARGGTVTSPSLTTSASGEQVVAFFGFAASATFTPSGGLTERWDVASDAGSYKVAQEAADLTVADPGLVGPFTADPSGTAVGIGALVALRPGGG
ncbi:MAG TPA: Ig-like domain-containing protein, partial [Candidatus Limnocylindrales bacterium]|nr:Ig-like domain-containing protein [Candidatus Limnocylindrales bacterium]